MKLLVFMPPIWAAILLLSACAAPPPAAIPTPLSALVPPELQHCPEGRPPPRPPPPPRTLQQLVDWVVQVDAALLRTEHARAECAARLGRLNEAITSGQLSVVRKQVGP
ncbi:hypothetical protein [Rhodopila sp.]|uniref:hypothetical protein n=1 Tax=Rhodopila sp. TaxID=2480087 RepID=UPI003D12F5DD